MTRVVVPSRNAGGSGPSKSANAKSVKELVNAFRPDLELYEEIRKKLHAHPELSQQESNTAALVVKHLSALKGYVIHEKIGGHGVAAVLENGAGKTVLLRADMDALPVKEQTGLPYASKVTMQDYDGVTKPVMHACGHDTHVTSLLAAATSLAKMRSKWSGTLVLVFQPDEERGGGAKSMVDDGLYDRVPIPDIVLGQHVSPERAGSIGLRPGVMLAASDSFKVTMFGRGGHASMPNRTIDPVVMAASAVMRLQTIVSREIDPGQEVAVVTVGSLQAGQTENVIADDALIRINVRTIDTNTRQRVVTAIKRIINAEADASGAKKAPEILLNSSFPVTTNDPSLTSSISSTFEALFGSDFNPDLPRVNGSEDFGYLATSIGRPSCFWMFGGTDPELWDDAEKRGTLAEDVPVNHSPFFAPVMQPTLKVAIDAMTSAALTFLA